MYIISFLSLLDRMGRPRFISLPSFCRDSLTNMFFRFNIHGTVRRSMTSSNNQRDAA